MTAFGTELRAQRQRRRMSQLDLALEAGVSARHVSFLETGRARPSRGMVLTLADKLSLPRPQRNRCLQAAGFAPVHSHLPLSTDALAPIRAAMRWTLSRHDPYPGFALDRDWTVVEVNRSATRMLDGLGITMGDNLIEAAFADGAGPFENAPELARGTCLRLRTEAADQGGNPRLEALADRLEAEFPQPDAPDPLPPFIPAVIRLGGMRLSFITTLAQFGTAEDIALADLRIELMYPADETTRKILEGQGEAQT